MKIKFISLAILFFTLVGCCECSKCKTENDTTKNNQIINGIDNEELDEYLLGYVPIQSIESIPSDDNYNYERYRINKVDENYFNCNDEDGIIHVEIPVTNINLKIVDVVNVSSKDLNSIIILLDGNGGNETDPKGIKGKIVSDLKISKIKKLKAKKMKDDKKIKVFVYHDNYFSKNVKNQFKKCVKDLKKQYKKSKCKLIFIEKEGITRPAEQEDDILNSGINP